MVILRSNFKSQERNKTVTTGKALDGKPYAGNPHVRFDEGEVAPAAKPRRGSLLYNDRVSETDKAIVLQGKLDAGNPNIRFDEWADVPKRSVRSALFYMKTTLFATVLSLSAAALAATVGENLIRDDFASDGVGGILNWSVCRSLGGVKVEIIHYI